MTGNRGRGSRFQLWIGMPVSGLLHGGAVAALTAHGLDQARTDTRTTDLPSAADDHDSTRTRTRWPRRCGCVPARRSDRRCSSRAPPSHRPSQSQPTSLMVATVLSEPGVVPQVRRRVRGPAPAGTARRPPAAGDTRAPAPPSAYPLPPPVVPTGRGRGPGPSKP